MLRGAAIVYPARFEPPRQPEAIVYADSWCREPILPVRRKVSPNGRGATVDAINTSHPLWDAWAQPLSDPTRRITRRYGEKVEAFDPTASFANGWTQPLSEPTRRKWTPLGRGSIIDRIDTSHPDVSGWAFATSQPTLRPVRPDGEIDYAIQYDFLVPEEILADKWSVAWLPPTLRITRRLGAIVDAINTTHPNLDAWLIGLSEPTRRKWTPLGRTEIRDFINTDSPHVSGWTQPIGIPVRRVETRKGFFADQIKFDAPAPAPEQSWYHPWLPPTRLVTRRYGNIWDRINPVATPAPAMSWFHPFTHQVPLSPVPRRGRMPITSRLGFVRDRIDPTTIPAVLASHWHRQWSEPRRFLRDPRANVVLMMTSGGIWVTTGAYEPGAYEIMLSDQFSPFVYTAEIHPWATGRD